MQLVLLQTAALVSLLRRYAYAEGGAHSNGIFTCRHTLQESRRRVTSACLTSLPAQDIIPSVLLLFTV